MRILLPFFDDSTLIFAAKIKPMLVSRGFDVLCLRDVEKKDGLSERQMTQLMPEGADITADGAIYGSPIMNDFDAVIVCKGSPGVRRQLSQSAYRRTRNRPAYVAFQPGLEFTPEKGRKNRKDFDIVFLNNTDHRDKFLSAVRRKEWQHVSFGHPYFMLASQHLRPTGRNIYFFAQAISPVTLESRRFMLDILITMARRHPDREVRVKLRHLPNENSSHAHKEVFSYPWLLDRYFQDVPENFRFTVCTMEEALKDAGIAITCTSTAAMDAISAGVPTFVYVDYTQNYLDKYTGPMRREFMRSGLLTNIPRLMELDYTEPDKGWLSERFRGDDLFVELKAAIEAFKTQSSVSF